RLEPPQQVTIRVEYIDETVALTCNIVVFRCILFRISDEQVPVEAHDVERRVAGGDLGVAEVPVERCFCEHSVRAVREIGREQKRSLRIHGERETLVDRATR